MSRHYLIDGYNLIKQIPQLADKSLEDGRLALIRWLNVQRPQGSVNNKVTVVFDGNPEFFGGHDGGDVKVIFSQYGSADDEIKRMVERCARQKNITVVSNDKDVFLYARALGTETLSIAQFVGDAFSSRVKKTGKSSAGEQGKKQISLSQQDKINKELKKLWGI